MRSLPTTVRNLLILRTEAIRQFRIAFKAHAPAKILDDLRAEVAKYENVLDKNHP